VSLFFFFFSSRRRHTRFSRDWSSDVCSSDLLRDYSAEIPGCCGNILLMNSVNAPTAPRGAIDRFFKISQRGSTVGREIRGGLVRSEERRVGKERRVRW